MIIWVVKILVYSSSSVYSCHLFLISSASVRSIPFLSFILLIFAWNVCLHSDKSQVCCLIVSLSVVIIYGCVTNHLRRHWLKTVSILFLLMNLLLGQGSWEKTCLWSTRVSWYGSNSLGRSSPHISLACLTTWHGLWSGNSAGLFSGNLASLDPRHQDWKLPVSSSLTQHHFCHI